MFSDVKYEQYTTHKYIMQPLCQSKACINAEGCGRKDI